MKDHAPYFTEEQTAVILSAFGEMTDEQRQLVFHALGEIYKTFMKESWGGYYMLDVERHRERLASIVSAAKRLNKLLSNEPLRELLLLWPELRGSLDPISCLGHAFTPEEWDLRNRLALDNAVTSARFFSTLSDIEGNAKRLLDDEEELRGFRSDTSIEARHKSIQRRTIWEPMFRLWRQCGKPVGTSRSGRLPGVIRALHICLDLPPPNVESLYRAVRDFKAAEVG